MKKVIFAALVAALAFVMVGCSCAAQSSSAASSAASTSSKSASASATSASTSATSASTSATSASASSAAASSTAQSAATAQSSQAAQSSEAAPADEGQNPVMNFVGVYSSDRASITVEAQGKDGAAITVEWGSSANEGSKWTMSGQFNADSKTVAYNNCTKVDYTFESEETKTETTVYTDGSGQIVFDNGSLQWADDKEHVADGMTFTFA